ncbi:TraM-binding TraD/TraG-like protein [Umezawaea tangerina]|uniref:TraM-binding TraD/TraG-like protein n=1 Tax=Umezawaea tangerina TaxID=84725 RepID=A0A2T0T4C3_9PSEU|nr:TraM-binding TraD/TraG-like protein [Umezawaea tangerina]
MVIDPAGSPGEGVVGFNPLAGPPEEAERRADEMVGLFRNLYGSAIGPRSTDVLLHATLTVAKLPGGSLADIPVLLSNAVFRRKHLPGVSDPLVLGPWWAWFESMSEAERQQVTAPINNKLRAFLSRAAVRRLLAPDGSAFTLDDLFTKRRVVLVNLNAGLLGTEACRLLGSLLLSSFWSAAERRAAVPKEDRYPVRVVVDEFASYIAALDFDAVLALARGLGVSITVAHQNVAQLTASLLATVAANARSRVVFRPSPSDEKTLTALLGADVLPGDLARIGAFQAAARLYIDGEMTPTFTVQTLSLPDATTDPDAMRSESRRRYGTDGEEIDRRLLERWHGDSPPSDSPIGVRRRRTTA